MKAPELLAPAGNMEKMCAAIFYGADAVYLAGPEYGLRMGAENFTIEQLPLAVNYAHQHKVKLYVTVNIFAHHRDLQNIRPYLFLLRDIGVDGVIVADPGILSLVRAEVPGLPVHLSTQANVTNRAAAAFWEGQGVSRIVLARELSLDEIEAISCHVKVPLEVFIHGAMCISYSGRCLLSKYMTGRDANLGDCAQPCRWRYALSEGKRPGQYFPVLEDDRGTYLLSSRDLCLISHLPELARAGVGSFKIEGRVKSVHYVATVVKVYREAIDRMLKDQSGYEVDPKWLNELGKVSNRDYTTGFISGDTGLSGHGDVEGIYRRDCTFVGIVRDFHAEEKMIRVEQRNRFFRGETLELLMPGSGTPNRELLVAELYDQDRCAIDSAPHPCQTLYIPVDFNVPAYSLLRRLEDSNQSLIEV